MHCGQDDLLTRDRIRLLRCISTSGTLSIPIYPIRLDTYGIIPNCGPSALHHEQCLRRHDLVLPTSIPCHLQ